MGSYQERRRTATAVGPWLRGVLRWRAEAFRLPLEWHVRKNVLRLLLPLLLIGGAVGCEGDGPTLVLATTTSTADSRLLEVILPPFEEASGVRVKVLAVGTGQALALGEQGDADIVLVHARAREDEFVASGHGVDRRDLMYNRFVILGPPEDPAGIAAAAEGAIQALQRIARVGGAGGAAFVSRADGSGTHLKERQLWEEAGISPQGDWYRETGQGMGNTLTIANEMGAYTLSDQGTYLSRREGLDLFVMSSGGALLLNPYGIIAVNPALHPRVERDLAEKLIEYLTSHQTQERIAAFGRDLYGEPLFYPDSEAWRAEQ